MSAVACPACQKALPDSVLKGPAQAVVRCDGCSTLLLWSHGKVVRSARSSPNTLQGVPAIKPPPATATPPKPAKPLAKTLMGMSTQQLKAADEEVLDAHDLVIDAQPPPTPSKGKPEKPEKSEPPLAELKPEAEPGRPTQTLGRIAPIKRDALKPSKPEPSKPEPKLPEAKLSERRSEAKPAPRSLPDSKPQVVAAVAPEVKAMPGPLEDPSEWFDDTTVQGEPSDEDPTNVGPTPVSSKKAKDPSPAPLAPQRTTMAAAPKAPEAKPAARSLFAMSTEPAAKAPLPEQKTVTLQAPEQKTVTLQAPEQKTVTLQGPQIAPALPKPAAKPISAKPLEEAKPEPAPLPLPPPTPTPKSPFASPTPMAGAVEPQLDLGPDKRRPPIWIAAAAAGGALLLVVVGVVLLKSSHSGDDHLPVATTTPPKPPEKPVEPPPPPPVPPPVAPPPVAVVAPTPSQVPAVPTPDQPTGEEPAPRHHRGTGAKKVVLEYDSGKKEPVETKSDDAANLDRARDAYKRGNERLFTGNSSAAIDAYKESLSIYPGYVAGYRGLGLAYAQEGNTDEALSALRTYVKTVPNAHDVPLIRKRIEHLEKASQP